MTPPVNEEETASCCSAFESLGISEQKVTLLQRFLDEVEALRLRLEDLEEDNAELREETQILRAELQHLTKLNK